MTGRRVRDLAARLVPPLCAAVALLGLWELWVRWTHTPRFLFCAPSEIVRDAMARAGELAMATWKTTIAVAWGFALSAVVGIAVGVMLSSSRLLERALYPFTVILQTVPLVAIAPMLVIWLHAGVQAVSVCAFIVSLFPVITNTLSGIRSIPHPQVELFRLYGARPWAVLTKLKLPGAVPSIMAGLRIAAGLDRDVEALALVELVVRGGVEPAELRLRGPVQLQGDRGRRARPARGARRRPRRSRGRSRGRLLRLLVALAARAERDRKHERDAGGAGNDSSDHCILRVHGAGRGQSGRSDTCHLYIRT